MKEDSDYLRKMLPKLNIESKTATRLFLGTITFCLLPLIILGTIPTLLYLLGDLVYDAMVSTWTHVGRDAEKREEARVNSNS